MFKYSICFLSFNFCYICLIFICHIYLYFYYYYMLYLYPKFQQINFIIQCSSSHLSLLTLFSLVCQILLLYQLYFVINLLFHLTCFSSNHSYMLSQVFVLELMHHSIINVFSISVPYTI